MSVSFTAVSSVPRTVWNINRVSVHICFMTKSTHLLSLLFNWKPEFVSPKNSVLEHLLDARSSPLGLGWGVWEEADETRRGAFHSLPEGRAKTTTASSVSLSTTSALLVVYICLISAFCGE